MEARNTSLPTERPTSSSSGSDASLPSLDLSGIPPIAILSTHLSKDEENNLQETLKKYHAPLTTDIARARVFVGKVSTKRRAEFELRSRKLVFEDATPPEQQASLTKAVGRPIRKRRLFSETRMSFPLNRIGLVIKDIDIEEPYTGDEVVEQHDRALLSRTPLEDMLSPTSIFDKDDQKDIIWVIRMNWIKACITAGHVVSLANYLVYRAKVVRRPGISPPVSIKSIFTAAAKLQPTPGIDSVARQHIAQEILERARSDAAASGSKSTYQSHYTGKSQTSQPLGNIDSDSSIQFSSPAHSYVTQLLQQSTSEYESEDHDVPPAFNRFQRGVKYACQRFTPDNGPNKAFLAQLEKIMTVRTLLDDRVGVRAYSTSIAAIAAYPLKLNHPWEITQIPGCSKKIEALFIEWKETGKIEAVEKYENDEAIKVLRSFCDIWGVGAKTARHFYYNNKWTELNNIIEYGWNDLDRVQQVGLKYYDEFLTDIPMIEVQLIASVVEHFAINLRDEHITVTVVGGYRCGKEAPKDVELILSHPDLEATAGLIREVVEALEKAEWISYTLTMSLGNTNRGQQTLPIRSAQSASAGSDALDKALVVWQEPLWPSRQADLAKNPRAKNPGIHRRVVIIVSPWRTVGCAVLGWTGGTTFQRDLKRYAKNVKGWKFDSSGIRNRSNGEMVRLEGLDGVQGTPEDAEKVVFEGLGLEFIPPEYRFTY